MSVGFLVVLFTTRWKKVSESSGLTGVGSAGLWWPELQGGQWGLFLLLMGVGLVGQPLASNKVIGRISGAHK